MGLRVTCAYCEGDAKLVDGRKIYPYRPDLFEKKFWECEPCKAYVGCHPSTSEPLGRLANAELRRMKQAAHAAFDPLWKYYGMSRTGAYHFLADRLGIKRDECHIGMFDEMTCAEVIVAAGAEVRRRKEINKRESIRGQERAQARRDLEQQRRRECQGQ